MKKTFLYFLLAATLVIQIPMIAFAEEAPPSINFAFDDDEDDAPPTLGEITIPEPEAPVIPAPTVVTPPVIPPTVTTPPVTPNPVNAAATLATNNSSTSISQTGPETGYLIVLSLILGYISTKRLKKPSKEEA